MEGPYGEMLGYIGEPAPNHFMTVKAITHRKKPWVYNIWPGIGGAYLTWPWQVGHFARLKRIMPNLVKLHMPPDIPSMVIACINKRLPGEGIEAGLFDHGLPDDRVQQEDDHHPRQGRGPHRPHTGVARGDYALAALAGQPDRKADLLFHDRPQHPP